MNLLMKELYNTTGSTFLGHCMSPKTNTPTKNTMFQITFSDTYDSL